MFEAIAFWFFATILLLSAADGCDALVLPTTDLVPVRRQPAPVDAQLKAANPVPYASYLTWRGQLVREPPRRPEPDRPAAPPSARGGGWKFAFTGSRCEVCAFVHLPPARVCHRRGAVDQMSEARLADTPGTVATFTVDRLAFSPSPPLVDAVVTPTELVLMEDKGFSDRGQAWKDILAGDFELAGRLPVNPDGGLKSFGHPVGASGLRMLYEAWLQLRHEAGQRQIEGPRLALTHNLGGRPGSCVSFVSIVGGEQGVRGGKR